MTVVDTKLAAMKDAANVVGTMATAPASGTKAMALLASRQLVGGPLKLNRRDDRPACGARG
jgi:hypothetical protein